MVGTRRDALGKQCDWLLGQVKKHPELTLDALPRQLERRGCKVACDTLSRFLRKDKHQLLKKTLFAEEQKHPDVQRRRSVWKRRVQDKFDSKI